MSAGDVEADDGTLLAKKKCRRSENKRTCVREYTRKKSAVSEDNPTASAPVSSRCALPSDSMSDKDRQAMARCLRARPAETDASKKLDTLLHRHLWQDTPATGRCVAFLQRGLPSSSTVRSCLRNAGAATWTADGLQDINGSQSACGRRWHGTKDARCLLKNKDLAFIGNSVIRRQMYSVLDLLAGKSAHRLLPNGTSIDLGSPRNTSIDILNTRVWDQDGHANGYHAAQLFTIDLTTGAHRFHLPHTELCGLGSTHSNFNAGRARQWWQPSGTLTSDWRSTKWAGREWRPLVSLTLDWPPPTRSASCAADRSVSWGGSYQGSFEDGGPSGVSNTSFGSRLSSSLLSYVRKGLLASDPSTVEWLSNLSIHIEQPAAPLAASSAAEDEEMSVSGGPSAWIVFPSYHGQRISFNGYCGDPTPKGTPCVCTDKISGCDKPPCKGRKRCAPLPRGSDKIVDAARTIAARFQSHAPLTFLNGAISVRRARASPLYDDCWLGRDRCQGYRPCHERLDAGYICRGTAMLCPFGGGSTSTTTLGPSWPDVLSHAKAWIPNGHAHASLLYLYDGQTQETADATFKTWAPHSVGYGSHAFIFGPQFASMRSSKAVVKSLAIMRTALKRAEGCTGRKTVCIFRSPAFNFDPINSFAAQASFARRMRPHVEKHDFAIFLDTYTATYDAAFPKDASIGARFDRNSAFHYLDAGRYVMADLLLHVFALLR